MNPTIATLATLALSTRLLVGAAETDPLIEGGWDKIQPIELTTSTVEMETGSPTPQELVVLDKPEITAHRYLIAGEIRYTDATGYLEMWNQFGETRYFSRTLGELGPMAKIAGSSDWRPFMLPFNAEKDTVPDRLEINAVLTGGGSIEIRDVSLYQTDVTAPGQMATTELKASAKWLVMLAGLFAIVVFLVIFGLLRRQKTARELRKMQVSNGGQ